MTIQAMYRQRWALLYLPLLLAATAAVAWIGTAWMPLPPRQITLAAGTPAGGYAQLAERYRTELELHGILVDIVTTSPGQGPTAPLARLTGSDDAAQAGFAHSLLASRDGDPGVKALAIVGKQPLWIFSRLEQVQSVAQMKGLRVAAGARGGPAHTLATTLVARAGLTEADITWSDLQGMRAANALQEQALDVVITIGSADAPSVRQLMQTSGIWLVGVDRVAAITAREPRLGATVLPQGAVELRGDVPARDLPLVYANTHLLVRETMHPALQRALLDAAVEIHSVPSFLQRQAEYPSFDDTAFALTPAAQRYAQGQRPWLETLLPYWWAQLAYITLVAVLPALFITTLAMLWVPRVFSIRVSAMLAHYYGAVMFLEADLEKTAADRPMQLRRMVERLDELEREVIDLDLPDAYADRWYTLREHLARTRERLLEVRAR